MLGGEIDLSRISENEFGYLKGFFIGDGYKYSDKKYRRSYVEFYVHSQRDTKIREFIVKVVKNAGLNPHEYKDKRFDCIRIRITNKNFYQFFDKSIRNLVLPSSQVMGFISGFLDAEGYVNNEKRFIQIVNTDFEVLDYIRNELEKKNVSSSLTKKWVSQKMKKPSYNLYVSVKFKKLPHLSIKAGWRSLEFSPGP